MPKMNISEYVGKTYGHLKVNDIIYKFSAGRIRSFFVCTCLLCNTISEKRTDDIQRGNIVTCGNKSCYHHGHITHGLSKTKLYTTYKNMIDRCENRNSKRYHDYGGRGISICKEWRKDFSAFYYWAINNGYACGLSIDRINNDGNYEPSNCRWSTPKVQANNRRPR